MAQLSQSASSTPLSDRLNGLRWDIGRPFPAWDDLVHGLQESLSHRSPFSCTAFRVAGGWLLHLDAPPLLDTLIISAIGGSANLPEGFYPSDSLLHFALHLTFYFTLKPYSHWSKKRKVPLRVYIIGLQSQKLNNLSCVYSVYHRFHALWCTGSGHEEFIRNQY